MDEVMEVAMWQGRNWDKDLDKYGRVDASENLKQAMTCMGLTKEDDKR
jgi:hypothetical protein